jgi:hypothetical protein
MGCEAFGKSASMFGKDEEAAEGRPSWTNEKVKLLPRTEKECK